MKTIIKYIYSLIGLCCLIAFAACDDGDSFTVSPSNVLTFSVDTVKLDTLFSTIPSSTRSFWVYNNSGDGLRNITVRLEGGNQKGFRVNVDGAYLSPEQGYKVSDIEVRNKDSIRVYVELTSAVNYGATPKELKDNLVFVLESGVQQKVALNAWSWDATLLRSPKVESDLTLDSSKPIVVYGDMDVEPGATLTLLPGTKLYFHGNAGLNVKGRLVCKGTATDNVVMRGDRLDRMFAYLPYDRVSGQWRGIKIFKDSYDNEIDHTDIHGAFEGLRVDSSDVSRLSLSLTNSIVHNCQGNALNVVCSKVVLENCQLTNALYHCLAVDGGDVSVNNCTIAQFYPFDSARGSALSFSGINYPLVNFNCRNTLITGYANDEMMGGRPTGEDANAFNFNFANCTIRTPEVTDEDDEEHFVDVEFEDVADSEHYGIGHFVKIDANMQDYNFHLRKDAGAIGKANPDTATKHDMEDVQRDDKPDVGAYEYIEAPADATN